MENMKLISIRRSAALALILALALGCFPWAGAASDVISCRVEPGKAVALKREDFRACFQQEFGEKDTLRYVTFAADSSLRSSVGTFCYDYEGDEEETFDRAILERTKFYDRTSRYGDYPLDMLSFVAAPGTAETVVTVDFTAWGDEETCTGQLSIRIGSGEYDLSCTLEAGDSIALKGEEFRSFFESRSPEDALRYVTFQTNSSLRSTNGVLYYDYGGEKEVRFDRDGLEELDFYDIVPNY